MRRLVVAALLLCAATWAAAELCPAPLALLIRSAERIVVVRVEKISIETIEGQPFTVATAAVTETLKGPREARIDIRLPGGQVGEFVMVVPGAPTLRVGEQYVAFLALDQNAQFSTRAFRPINLGEGLFALIVKNRRTYAVQALADAPRRFAACAVAAEQCAAQAGAMVEEVTAFKARIRAALASGNQ